MVLDVDTAVEEDPYSPDISLDSDMMHDQYSPRKNTLLKLVSTCHCEQTTQLGIYTSQPSIIRTREPERH